MRWGWLSMTVCPSRCPGVCQSSWPTYNKFTALLSMDSMSRSLPSASLSSSWGPILFLRVDASVMGTVDAPAWVIMFPLPCRVQICFVQPCCVLNRSWQKEHGRRFRNDRTGGMMESELNLEREQWTLTCNRGFTVMWGGIRKFGVCACLDLPKIGAWRRTLSPESRPWEKKKRTGEHFPSSNIFPPNILPPSFHDLLPSPFES